MSVLPNFLIIGQIKAGTSSLHAYLSEHPEVFMPANKELRLFSEVIGPEADGPLQVDPVYFQKRQNAGMPNSLAEYSALFAQGANFKAIGEASPEYVHTPRAAQQIYDKLPGVRLIVSLRRPSDRAYSNFQMADRGRDPAAFEQAFRDGMQSGSMHYLNAFEQLKAYYDLFDAQQIKAIKFDDLVSNTETTVKSVFEFLDVATDHQVDTGQAHNEGGQWKSPAMGKMVDRFRANWALMSKVKSLVPASVWQMAKSLESKNRTPAPKLTQELRAEIDACFSEDTKRLQDLVGVDLSNWCPEG